jgi:pimeloyl-ACP methyl ester carboxylesterase
MDLLGIIRQLQAGPVHVVGFSAATAVLAAVRAPDLMRTLTIIEPNVPSLLEGDPEGQSVLAWWRDANAQVLADAAGDPERHAILWFELVNQRGPGTFAEQPAAFREMWIANMTTPRSAPGPAPVDCRALRATSVPTLAVGSEDGMRYSRAILDRLDACLPDSRLVVLAGTTHFLTYQAPNAFNDLLLGFLGDH